MRVVQLFVSTAVLGVGVTLLLAADLGADGFAMLIDGTSQQLGVPFVVANTAISVLFVAMAWARGTRPGLGTVVLPVMVGGMVSLLDGVVDTPGFTLGQAALFAAAFAIVCVGVAGYLAADLGAGPTEAAALAWDPPLPFKWSYNAVQVLSGLIGWACGATLGVGTVVVVALIGPAVDRLIPLLRRDRRPIDEIAACAT